MLSRRAKKIGLWTIGLLVPLFVLFFGAMMLALLFAGGATSESGSCSSGNASNVDVTTSADMNKRAKSIYGYLRSELHATPQGAAGAMGVWQFESSFNPKIGNNAGSGATGLAQWMGNRLTGTNGLKAFASRKGVKWDSLQTQLDFTKYELNHGYQGAKAALRKSDVHKAAYDWLMDYEGMRNNPEQWYLEKSPSGQPGRYPDGDHWYAKFGANDTGADNSGDVSDPDDSGGTGNTGGCGSDASAAGGDWGWPYKGGKYVTSGFGPRDLAGSPWHDGVDFDAGHGAKIRAVHGGKVIFVGDPMKKGITDSYPYGLGKDVIVTKADDGYEVIYQEFAMSGPTHKVAVNDTVKTGQVIATQQTGHLHLGVTNKKSWVTAQGDWQNPSGHSWLDPLKFIEKKAS